MIDITGLNRADVLAALYNASRPQGLGFLEYDSAPMQRVEAENLLKVQTYFDYLHGRLMKLKLESGTSFDERLYDRYNGPGAALVVIDALRASGPAAIEIQAAHEIGKQASVVSAEKAMQRESLLEGNVFRMGLKDMAEPLSEAIRKATTNE